ncbi:hypothetical protein [Roseicyclus persicicus]|uniref:hypothetical protein n=1 Tax=Roseicyclus persicicus TaxID=2650661 RepID=UPI001B34808E|nr:hypothetical protein [Roseibacterium persicicum]
MARRLFLERRTYRQNRLQDAARLLPVLGLVLFFAPVFIRGDAAEAGPSLSSWLVYYFAVWIGLIVLTAVVSRALTPGGRAEPGSPPPPPEGEGG